MKRTIAAGLILLFLFSGLAQLQRAMGIQSTPAGGWITSRVSVASDGSQANDDSNYPAISADGRYVTFLSYATNLVPDDTNGVKDVFVHDLQTGQTSRISVASDGAEANFRSGDFEAPGISSDGRFIAFVSVASNLVISDTNNQQDVFVRDQQAGRTVRVSVAADGSEGNLWSSKPAISASGRFVAFVTSSALVPGDTNGQADVFVHDRDADADGVFDEPGAIDTVRVSVASDGAQGNGAASFTDVAISADGRHVSFDSYATNLVAGDTNNRLDTFVHDRDADNDGLFDEAGAIRTARVSVATNGAEANDISSDSEISADGRYVTFWSRASNLVPGDNNSCSGGTCYDVFVHDRDDDQDGVFDEPGAISTGLASIASDGAQGNNHSYFPAISADGRYVTFYSLASNLVPGDTGWVDIFVHDHFSGGTIRASLTNTGGEANGSSFMPDISGDGQLVVFDSVASNLVAGDNNARYDIFVHDRVLGQATPTPTFTPSATPTFTPTPSPTPTHTPEATPAAEGWQVQTLDVRGDTGKYASLVLDSQGYPHISYYAEQGLSGSLKYMRWDGVVWRVATVDDAANVGEYSNITLDDNDYPHISYRDATNGALKYARWTGFEWQVQTVDAGPGVGFFSRIAVQPLSNIPHIIYVDFLQERLSHIYWNGASWFPRLVADGAGMGQNSDLAFDGNGVLHATFYDGPHSALRYGTFDGQSWSSETVNSTGDVGQHNSLAFDSQDRPHISYYDASLDALKYAHHDGSSWQTDYVNINGEGGQYTSIALDSGDVPHISYFDGHRLQLAREFGATWDIDTVDEDGQTGWYTALGLDGFNVPHIAYHDNSYGDLKYAYYGPHWEFRPVSQGSGDHLPSLDLDNAVPGMTYHNSSAIPDQLSLAGWDGTMWDTTHLDESSGAAIPSSLKYDASGTAHVGYVSADRQRILYGTWDGSQWQRRIVDQISGGDSFGEQIVVLLDDNTWPMLVYTRWLAGVHSVWLAQWDGAAWQTTILTGGQPLGADSYIDAALSAGASVTGGGTLYVSYYEQGQGDLRLLSLAVDAPIPQTDTLVDSGNGVDTGQFNRIVVDVRLEGGQTSDVVSVAYFDVTNQNVMYAFREDGWVHKVAVYNTGPIGSLDLVLGNDAWLTPYIAYTALSDNSLRLVYSQDGLVTWPLEVVPVGSGAAPADVSLAFDFAPRLAYRDAAGAIQYAFPASRHNVGPAPAHADGAGVGPVLGFDGKPCLDFSLLPPSRKARSALFPARARDPVTDLTVLGRMTNLFAASPDGQTYIGLYNAHASEMGRIGWSDPALLWDSYRTLHNLMPGLEALVLGAGAQVTVTQQMADQALDIWQRIAAAAGPDLAQVINDELAQSNNLQAFVGLTFDQWAEAIGVSPPAPAAYLPVAARAPTGRAAPGPPLSKEGTVGPHPPAPKLAPKGRP